MYLYTVIFPNGQTIFLGVTEKKMSMDEIKFVFKEANKFNTIGEITEMLDNSCGYSYSATISTGESAEIYCTFVTKWEQ